MIEEKRKRMEKMDEIKEVPGNTEAWKTLKVNIDKWGDGREIGKRKVISSVDIEDGRSRKRKDNKITVENKEEKQVFGRKDKISRTTYRIWRKE